MRELDPLFLIHLAWIGAVLFVGTCVVAWRYYR
jgi:hypothetical protein